MFDITLLVGISTLGALHLRFGWKALRSTSLINKKARSNWLMLSLILGPMGYYFYLGMLPCDLIADE